MHQHNASKQAIQKFKNHFIAVLCSVNTKVLLQNVYRLLDQSTNTLNLLQKIKINSNPFTNEQLYGIFNFNVTSFSPPETRMVVHDNPEKRATYDPHVSYGW